MSRSRALPGSYLDLCVEPSLDVLPDSVTGRLKDIATSDLIGISTYQWTKVYEKHTS